MSFFNYRLFFKIAAVLYAVAVPGHIVSKSSRGPFTRQLGTKLTQASSGTQQTGNAVMFPRFEDLPARSMEDSAAKRGAYNCWWAVATYLTVLGKHWKKPSPLMRLSSEQRGCI